MIIDAHSHLGKDVVFDCEHTEEYLLEKNEKYGISGGIVQPFVGRPYMEETKEYHDSIFRFCQEHEKYWGMASINPHFRHEEYFEEARRCVKELGFVGLKLTPVSHSVNPESEDGLFVFETARILHVPVMVHTGYGLPFSDPAKLKKAAIQYQDVTMVIAHLGSGLMATQAIWLAKEFPQIYLEPSGCGIGETYSALNELNGKKVMFSSDSPLQLPTELAKYRTILEDHPEWEDDIFFRSAQEAFRLQL